MEEVKERNKDYWCEVEDYLSEGTPSGYKMAIVEADKILYHVLKQKGFPGKDIKVKIFYAGWELEDKRGLRSAIKAREDITQKLDYKLSTFDAEDAINAYKEAIIYFSKNKKLDFFKKSSLYYTHYISYKSPFLQKAVAFVFTFFLLVKFFNSTEIGKKITSTLVAVSNFIFSWFTVFLLLGTGFLIIVIGSFFYFGKEKTRIKE